MAMGDKSHLSNAQAASCISRAARRLVCRKLEATPRIELGMEVLQTSALPLGYVALGPWSILPVGAPSSDGAASHRLTLAREDRLLAVWHRRSSGTSWRDCRRASSWSAPDMGPDTEGSPPAAWSPSLQAPRWCWSASS